MSTGQLDEPQPDGEHDPNSAITEPGLIGRSLFGGVLMGLANLVPGISGGTMLLVAGVYPAFIDAVASLTRMRLRAAQLVVLGCVGGAAALSIVLLAGPLKTLVVEHRFVMYSLFIGLTLGGVPLVWGLARPATRGVLASAGGAFLGMVCLTLLQANGVIGTPSSSVGMLFFAGLAGASAMILPGVSGGYLLLLLGQYVTILRGIDRFKQALGDGDLGAATAATLEVMLPVGLGVIVGVVVVGNALQWLLKRHRPQTLGALLGLLLGSVVGLFPFQQGIPPQPGDTLKGQLVTVENVDDFEADDWNTEFFRPTLPQAALSVALVGVGLGITVGISRIGQSGPARRPAHD